MSMEARWRGPGGPPATNRVREYREHRLMTQAELAAKARVALRTLHSVEKGMNCRPATKRRILGALELPFEDRDLVFPPDAPGMVGRRRQVA
jgi:DNA-binding XRE family transcriptional regulator